MNYQRIIFKKSSSTEGCWNTSLQILTDVYINQGAQGGPGNPHPLPPPGHHQPSLLHQPQGTYGYNYQTYTGGGPYSLPNFYRLPRPPNPIKDLPCASVHAYIIQRQGPGEALLLGPNCQLT